MRLRILIRNYQCRPLLSMVVLVCFLSAGRPCLSFQAPPNKLPVTTSGIQCIQHNLLVSSRNGRKRTRVSVRSPLQPCSDGNHQDQPEPTRKQRLTAVFSKSFVAALLVFQLTTSSSVEPANAVTVSQYWALMDHGPVEERQKANLNLVDYVVGTVSTMYYDHTGGATFGSREFLSTWRAWLSQHTPAALETRDGAVEAVQYMMNRLNDPFSKYLTRDELRQELSTNKNNDGFLGLGAMVEAPRSSGHFLGSLRTTVLSDIPASIRATPFAKQHALLSAKTVASLPVVSAVAPNSPAERAGLTVGDRIVAVQKDSFLGGGVTTTSVQQTQAKLDQKYHADSYFGTAELTVAKPVYANFVDEDNDKTVIVAYRPQRIKLGAATTSTPPEKTGILQYQLLTRGGGGGRGDQGDDTSTSMIMMMPEDDINVKVGYIRLTRFSKASTAAFLQAVQELEAQHAQAYILDLRNCYGGVIQESMLTAATLLRDPHAVLCYTLNSRGGFTPHQVDEYVTDARYPGYLLSNEPKDVSQRILQKEGTTAWEPPSSYASLAEQRKKLQIPYLRYTSSSSSSPEALAQQQLQYQMLAAQKPIVLLVNEGTASSAEVFASALHDNGRIVAVVGSKTFGKGLIQHTFPLPDGGGLRLTVAEYLTPALRHVTHVGGAQYDPRTGEFVGGGIVPDVMCESTHGIPANVGGDLCVGVGFNVLTEAQLELSSNNHLVRAGGVDLYGLPPSTTVKRPVFGLVRQDDF